MANSSKDGLSKGEWEIMNICWKKGKSTARVIHEESLKKKKLAYQTVKTVLDKIVINGFLKREKFGPLWLYEPSIPRQKAIKPAINSFVDIVLDNNLVPFFKHFIEGKRLSAEEIEILKKIIKNKK